MIPKSIPNIPLNLPWFMFDIDNKQLITTPIIPGDISDQKGVFLAEQPIPGLDHAPIHSGGMNNRKIAFTLQLINRDPINGNIAMLKQFENLRNQSFGYKNVFAAGSQFTPNPRVLYHWGIGSVPLVWYVSKCDLVHKAGWSNAFGNPKFCLYLTIVGFSSPKSCA